VDTIVAAYAAALKGGMTVRLLMDCMAEEFVLSKS